MIRTTKQTCCLLKRPDVLSRFVAVVRRGEPVMILNELTTSDETGDTFFRVLTRHGVGWINSLWFEES